jgi:hypothetical protein
MVVDVLNRSGDVVISGAIIVKSDEKRFHLMLKEGYPRAVLMSDLNDGKYKIVAHRTTEDV